MTNLVNLARDMLWTSAAAEVTAQAARPDLSAFNVGTSGSVANIYAYAQCSGLNLTGAVTTGLAFGLCMLEPQGDITPYRFKGACIGPNKVLWGFGYASTVGTSVAMQRATVIGCGEECDEIVAIAPLTSADPNFGDPLVFWCGGNASTNGNLFRGGMSVQRLISAPPQYGTAVS